MITLALTTFAALAGCAAPAALAPEGPSAAGTPLYEAMQEPGTAPAFGKQAR
jgi:hypothetical protein